VCFIGISCFWKEWIEIEGGGLTLLVPPRGGIGGSYGGENGFAGV